MKYITCTIIALAAMALGAVSLYSETQPDKPAYVLASGEPASVHTKGICWMTISKNIVRVYRAEDVWQLIDDLRESEDAKRDPRLVDFAFWAKIMTSTCVQTGSNCGGNCDPNKKGERQTCGWNTSSARTRVCGCYVE
jgi:hypothetical protein